MLKVCLTVVCSSVLFGATVTVPNAQTDSSGNLQNGGPPVPVPGITQMLFASSQFTSGPIVITALSFRAKVGTGPVSIDYGDVNVYLSTSPKSPDAASPNPMSLTFDQNKGTDFALVFSGLGVVRSSPGCAGPAMCPFDLTNTLATPFYYDPSMGNLLLQVTSSGFQDLLGTSAIDAMSFDSNALIAEVAAFGTTTATDGFFYEPRGLITQFAYTETPEPAAFLLTGLGLSALLWRRRTA